MIAVLLLLILSQDGGVLRDANGKILRHRTPVHAFMKANPCPDGPDKGSTTRCRGYKADHKIPLCAGGPDEVGNLSWQTTEAARQKDYLEIWVCKNMVRKSKCGIWVAPDGGQY